MANQYAGSCHCGNVRFTAVVDLDDSYVVDCSICSRKGSIANRVMEGDFTLETPMNFLGVYTFNTGIAKHYFCKNCGVHVFHNPRSAPEIWSVNVRCLEGVDLDSITPKQVYGSKLD